MSAVAIVVTHNSAKEIIRCVGGLTASRARVLVFDNASVDGTAGLVRTAFPNVEVIESTQNLGFGAAVNRCVENVNDELVILVNPDCFMTPTAVDALCDYLGKHPQSIVGPRILDANGNASATCHPFETLRSVVLSRFGGAFVPRRVRMLASGRRRREAYQSVIRGTEPIAVDWLSGACLAFPRKIFEGLGGFDERYFMYYEDEDLCWRAMEAGVDVVYLPTSSVVHVGGRSSTSVGQSWPDLYRSMLVFFALRRPASLPGVRVAIVGRAFLGTLLAGLRALMRDPTASSRRLAWKEVMRLGLTQTQVDLVADVDWQPKATVPIPAGSAPAADATSIDRRGA